MLNDKLRELLESVLASLSSGISTPIKISLKTLIACKTKPGASILSAMLPAFLFVILHLSFFIRLAPLSPGSQSDLEI